MHLLLLAVAPATIIILYIYFKDKFEKEPIPFLVINFIQITNKRTFYYGRISKPSWTFFKHYLQDNNHNRFSCFC